MSAVLIVDDERAMRLVLATFLKRKGVQVSEASGVSEAVQKIQQERYDVVITDDHLNRLRHHCLRDRDDETRRF